MIRRHLRAVVDPVPMLDAGDLYEWTTTSGRKVLLDGREMNAFAAVERQLTGARAIWLRVPRSTWERL